MVKESVRKCSHCGHNGHNSRTCNGKGCLNSLKLFGVTILTDKEGIRKTKSMGNLTIPCHREHSGLDAGYLSDGLIHSPSAKDTHDRKKGVAWTEDEHRSFLSGLEKLGKGDWRGIAKNYVPSRTPTQVASHAQKYYLRLTSTDKKKRRSSLFDMSFKELGSHHSPPLEPPDKSIEISQQVETSPAAANLNSPCHTQVQSSTSSQVGSPLDAPPVLSLAASSSFGVPNLRQMPFMPMVGISSNWHNFPGPKVIPTVSFVPVINYPNHGYFCLPKSYGNCN